MSKKYFIALLIISIFAISIFTVFALQRNEVEDKIEVYVNNTLVEKEWDDQRHQDVYNVDHLDIDVFVRETGLREDDLDSTNGIMVDVPVRAAEGYYIKNFTVTYDGNPIQLGFEGADEHGGHFDRFSYRADRDDYQFLVPNAFDKDADKKIRIDVEVAANEEMNIYATAFDGENYSLETLNGVEFGDSSLLIEEYRDGDIVIPEVCITTGCLLKLQFVSADIYSHYKEHRLLEDDNNSNWIYADAINFNDNNSRTVYAEDNMCDDEHQTCYIVVKKEFKDVAFAQLYIGYNKTLLYSPDYVGFDVSIDVENFSDSLFEHGTNIISVSEETKEIDLDIFYGTKFIYLTKKAPSPIINNNKVNNSHASRTFDNVVANPNPLYEVSYDDSTGIATIKIDSYYQDKIAIEFEVKDGDTNLLGDGQKMRLNLDRFAFGGNAGALLETDEDGRNCHNSDKCTDDEHTYYSTQYRGVLSAFYIAENTNLTENISCQADERDEHDDIIITDHCPDRGYARNTNFNPHAIALYYDENDEIIDEPQIFDLNHDATAPGFVPTDVFKTRYNLPDGIAEQLTAAYVYLLGNLAQSRIEDIVYFGDYTGETIMHDMVFISKAEAKEKGVKKIALFLVNGEVEKENIPELTYGVGEGRIMEIMGDN